MFALEMVTGHSLATLNAQDLATQRQAFTHKVQPMVEKYCLDCHSGDSSEGDFDLGGYDSADEVLESREAWQKALQRIRFGDMPPKDEVDLEDDERDKFIKELDDLLNKVDCTQGTNPGKVTIRRLNRNEYRNTIRSLIGLDYRPAEDFPGDDVGYGFDNIGDVLSLPPILLEKYLIAAESISKKAIIAGATKYEFEESIAGKELTGDGSSGEEFRWLATQGTSRWRVRIPSDGKYRLEYTVYGEQAGGEPVKIELFSGRESVRKSTIRATEQKPVTLSRDLRLERGTRSIGIRFLNDFYDPNAKDPNGRDRNLVITEMSLTGPLDKKPEYPATHKQIFFVTPSNKISEDIAARRILTRLASRAFRRPATESEINRLLQLVKLAKENGDSFEAGIQLALQAILVSPHFLFKVELPTKENSTRNLNDYELATSLSYFLWSSMPDDELFKTALDGKLKTGDSLRQNVTRMLKDKRASELVTNFVGQWLQLRNLKDVSIDEKKFWRFKPELLAAMKKETELFAWDIVQRDGSILEFLNADFTFVNRSLSRHYGLNRDERPKTDEEFKRVSLKGTKRGGLLTHGSILVITSNPTRTSPVKRGRWVLENLLNMPPPPPAPNVMELEDQAELTGTLREKMQQHRENPSCASCHAQMDPLGFAMENFDATGRWREKDDNQPIDATGELPSGKKFSGVSELQQLLLTEKQDQFVRCVAEKMLTFALGRGIEYYDRCAVDKIVEHVKKNDFRFSELVIAIVESEPFQKRRGKVK